jgi:hypothetical protein
MIFHMSRCGSTLISQMLKAIAGVAVFSEPSPVNSVVRAPEFGIDVCEEKHADWLRRIVRALGSALGQRAYFLKLDCWHAVDLPLFRCAFPSVPWIFAYRDPLEVLASHAAEPAEWDGSRLLEGRTIWIRRGCDSSRGSAEYRAHLLAGILRRVLECHRESEGHLVNYSQLPDWGWTTLPRIFELDPSAQEVAAMQEVATLDAKGSALTFAPERDRSGLARRRSFMR